MSGIITNPILKPYCVAGDKDLPPVSADTFKANQETGFPITQSQKLPAGSAVTRSEMNGVFNFYTNQIFDLGQGKLYTFNQALSNQIGGYSQGAILWAESKKNFVVSLIDSNNKNFVTTPSFINGVNWATLSSLTYPNIRDVGNTVSITGNGGLYVTAGPLAAIQGFSSLRQVSNSTQSIISDEASGGGNPQIVNEVYSLQTQTSSSINTIIDLFDDTASINLKAAKSGNSAGYVLSVTDNPRPEIFKLGTSTIPMARANSILIGSDFPRGSTAFGWTKLPNGTIFQWGRVLVFTTALTEVFPINFSTTNLSIQMTNNNGSQSLNSVTSYNTSGFTYLSKNGINGDALWFAIGY